MSPADVRLTIARVMSDGRERTTGDIARSTGFTPTRIRYAMAWLTDRKLIERNRVDRLHTYKKSRQSRQRAQEKAQ